MFKSRSVLEFQFLKNITNVVLVYRYTRFPPIITNMSVGIGVYLFSTCSNALILTSTLHFKYKKNYDNAFSIYTLCQFIIELHAS